MHLQPQPAEGVLDQEPHDPSGREKLRLGWEQLGRHLRRTRTAKDRDVRLVEVLVEPAQALLVAGLPRLREKRLIQNRVKCGLGVR